MVLEIAEIEITPGSAPAFARAYRMARHLLLEAGAVSVRLLGGVESPQQFRLLVEWDSVQAHRERFTSQPSWQEWRAAIGPFFARPPVIEHYGEVTPDATPDAVAARAVPEAGTAADAHGTDAGPAEVGGPRPPGAPPLEPGPGLLPAPAVVVSSGLGVEAGVDVSDGVAVTDERALRAGGLR